MTLYHEIHTSERKSFRGCRQRWDWRYRSWYQPATPIKPLEFGIAYHKAMEVLYDPDKWTWDREVVTELAVQAFEQTCDEQYRAFKASDYADYEDAAAIQDYDERRTLGRGMIRYYASLQPEMDKGLTPVQVEISFTVPVTNPVTGEQLFCKCKVCKRRWSESPEGIEHHDEWQLTVPREIGRDGEFYFQNIWKGLAVVYRGRIDCLIMDEHGLYWIYDWKTTARLMQDRDRWLDHDDQITSYCWALMVILMLPIQGFIYHEQFKNFPQPPKENKTVRLGCKYSVSKSAATDLATFVKYIKVHDAVAYEGGKYDEYIEWLETEGPQYSKRHVKYKTAAELHNVHANIYKEALDLTNPGLNIYPNPGPFNCQWCAYESPCIGKQRGDDYGISLDTLYTREAPYYLQPSTDSRGNQ